MRRVAAGFALPILLPLTLPLPAASQSLTAGAIRGSVVGTDGVPIAGVQVTLEAADGSSVRTVEADGNGEFAFALLGPGAYRVLAEQVGYQPVRRLGVSVSAGRTTAVALTLEKRPPPITAVTEINVPAGPAGGSLSRAVMGRELATLDYGRDVAATARGASEVVFPRNGADGFAVAAAGQPGGASRLFVDGVPEPLWRHPGLRGLPAETPLFQRRGVDQSQVLTVPGDAEWRGTAGAVLDAQSRRGTNRVRFEPYFAVSNAKIGGLSEQNPADSTATSFDGGFVVSGALVPDTAHFVIRADYRSLKTPSAFPWEADDASYRGTGGSLRGLLTQIAADSFGTDLTGATSPVVRTWEGGGASGNLAWRLNARNLVTARVGFSTWKESSPDLGLDAGNESETTHEGRDVAGALALTSAGATVANEARLGVSVSKREWLGSSAPSTAIVGSGVRVGGIAAAPALFERRSFTISEALQISKGRHRFKVGGNIDATSHDQDYRFGSAGQFLFGDLDQFGAGRGFYFRTTGAEEPASFRTTDVGIFAQDAWRVTPEIELLLALRYETQRLPTDEVVRNDRWVELSGIANDTAVRDRKGISPRVAFTWDVRNRGTWVIEGAAGLHYAGLDPALFGEVVQTSTGLRVRRGAGLLDSWPNAPSATIAPDAGARLSMLASTYRAPKTLKAGLGLRGQMSGGVTLRLAGSYHHTDYLSRRYDLNRVPGTIGETQEGRPVYGVLIKQGGLVAPEPGSNRRFAEFDLVSSFAPTGFVDHYEVTASLERQLARSLSFLASYTYSKTRDNLVGLLAADPADQLSPFPDGLGGEDWDEARSDLDIPHRFAATAEYRAEGRVPVTVSARYRWRSGLPFTPGLRRGLDLNGDGGGDNDPAYLDAGVTGIQGALGNADCAVRLNAFAERNSCRDGSVQGLDLGLRIGLPVGSLRSKVVLVVDAFNVVSSKVGVVDRALFGVDPAAPLNVSGAGVVDVPLVVNSAFGTLASRRGEPRLVRFGIGIEY